MRLADCSPSVKGPVDFTGYWALVKHEGMDDFLKAAGFPWVVRKAAERFGGSAVDVVAHTGAVLRVTSLNAKGSWSRSYDTEREVRQRNAEGSMCKTTSWWEGRVLRSRMEGSELGVLESWRYMRGNSMAVRTALRLPPRAPPIGAAPPVGAISSGSGVSTAATNGSAVHDAGAGTSAAGGQGQEVVCFWFFDRMETLQRHVAQGRTGGSLLQQIEQDQRRVERATRKDTAYIQDVLLDWQRWRSPADDFIHLASPPPMASRHGASRRRRSPGNMSPATMSKSPSNDSLVALPQGLEVRSEARSMHSESRSRLAESELSTAALDRMARQAAALALGPPDVGAADAASPPGLRLAAAAAGTHAHAQAQGTEQQQPQPGQHPAQQEPAQQQPAQQQAQHPAAQQAGEGPEAGGEDGKAYSREATLSYPREGGLIPVEQRSAPGSASAPGGHLAGADSLTFRPAGAAAAAATAGVLLEPEAPLPVSTNALLHPAMVSGPGSDVATRGSVQGSAVGSGGILMTSPAHNRSPSAGSAAGAHPRSVHYKNLSADSTGRGGSTPGRASPRSVAVTQHPLAPSEQIMSCRLCEFGDARGIALVVPVATPNDTSEPQLLSMSPEQAEETAAKLRELELVLMLSRQENRRGWPCCCFVLTLASDTLPDHLRVWESRLT